MSARRSFQMVLIVTFGLLFVFPLYWVCISAFRPEDDIFRYLSPLRIWTFLPNRVTFDNIVTLWMSPFARAIFNSIFVAVATVAGGLVVCAMAAFALAVIEFPGRSLVFTVMIVSFLIPFDAIAVPLYNVMRGFGLQNTYLGLILPGIGNGLTVFLLRQFFLGLPKDLREAGLVDGMGYFQIFWRIYLPLSVPALISAGLIMFIFQWQAYLWPLLIAPRTDLKVAAVAIAQFSSAYDVSFGVIFAGAMFVSLIPMIILVVFQQYFTSSVASTGGKE
ncbi:MAG: carbohydrate ABC transporter permease [Bosea sp.]|nr:carbohydrate ABC transporter permease [Bosea sp. (in: a-proteobacteria)]